MTAALSILTKFFKRYRISKRQSATSKGQKEGVFLLPFAPCPLFFTRFVQKIFLLLIEILVTFFLDFVQNGVETLLE